MTRALAAVLVLRGVVVFRDPVIRGFRVFEMGGKRKRTRSCGAQAPRAAICCVDFSLKGFKRYDQRVHHSFHFGGSSS
jgi:hypothetical protein